MEDTIPDRLMEEREELMVSPTGDGRPTLRIAHFLNPSLSSSMDNPPPNLSPNSPSSTTSKTQTQKDPLKVVHFLGWREPPKDWKSWADHMCSLHKPVWEKAGIYESIMGSVCSIRKDCELVSKVAEKWRPETNSFVFPFAEATVTLEDMMALGGYSVIGDSVLTPLPKDKALEETRKELVQARSEMLRGRARKAHQGSWLKKFMRSGSRIEHEAFLSLWLSRFVFPSACGYSTIASDVFPIAVLLARGTKIALAPAVLASIYRDLSLLLRERSKLREKSKSNVSALTVWAPLQLVQVWIWERFPALGPRPNPMRDGDPILARWHRVKKPITGNIDLAMASSGKCFQWRPYVMPECRRLINKLYGETEKWASLGRCMRVAQLVGLDCIKQYFPNRVAMQFGMDQDVPGKVVFHSNGNCEIAWEDYSRPILDAKLYIPSLDSVSEVTTRYLEWWRKSKGIEGVARNDNDYESDFPSECTRKKARTVPVKTENKVCFDFPSVPPGFPPNMVSKTGKEDFPSTPPGFSRKNIMLGDNESPPISPMVNGIEMNKVCFDFPSVPPGFPPNMVSKPGKEDFPSTPPGFSPKEVILLGDNESPPISPMVNGMERSKTGKENFPSTPLGFSPKDVIMLGDNESPPISPMVNGMERSKTGKEDFPSTPPDFSPKDVIVLEDNESPPISPMVNGMERTDFAIEDNTIPPTVFMSGTKGSQTRDQPSSTSDNRALQSVDLMIRSPENRMASNEDVVEGLERAVEDGNETGPGNACSQGEGTIHPPMVNGMERTDFANEDNMLPPTVFMSEMKGNQTGDPPSSTSDNGALQSVDLMRSPENRMASNEDVVEGLERAVEDGNETGPGNTCSQGEGTIHSRETKFGWELEARIVKLENLVAVLKARKLGNRIGL